MIRAMADHFKKGMLAPELVGRLKGFLAFAHSVEPKFAQKIRTTIGEERHSVLIAEGNVDSAGALPNDLP